MTRSTISRLNLLRKSSEISAFIEVKGLISFYIGYLCMTRLRRENVDDYP